MHRSKSELSSTKVAVKKKNKRFNSDPFGDLSEDLRNFIFYIDIKHKQESPKAAAKKQRKKTEILPEADKGKSVRERTRILSQKVKSKNYWIVKNTGLACSRIT